MPQTTGAITKIEIVPVGGEMPVVGVGEEVPQGTTLAATTAPPKPTTGDIALSPVKGAIDVLNPFPFLKKALTKEGSDEIRAGIGAGTVHEFNQIGKSAKEGRYLDAARHAILYAIPLLGPVIGQAGDELEEGLNTRDPQKIGHAIGMHIGLGLPGALTESPFAIGMGPKTVLPPEGQAAVAFGQAQGVPVDAATATGRPTIRAAQSGAINTPLGSMVGDAARSRQTAAMTATGQRLADRTLPGSVSPEQAGQGMRDTVTQRVRQFSQAADVAYDQLRQIEARPKNRTVIAGKPVTTTSPVLDASGNPITTTTTPTSTMQAAVDMRPVKTAMRPIYERLLRQMPVAQREASRGLLALENIVNGPDHMALSDADASLGAIKSLARSELPDVKTVSQGVAASAVTSLERAVMAKAKQLGPDAVNALNAGRTATILRHAAQDVLDTLAEEPVRTYQGAVTSRDAGIANLREVVQLAPQSARQIGRAWIDTALDKATAEGGFDQAAGLWADWQRLGPETKSIIFGQSLTNDLDKFFLLGKKLAEQPTPNKTALTVLSVGSGGLIFTEPVAGLTVTLGGAALAKALNSPRVVQALTRGFQMPIKNGAAAVAAANELMSAAKAAGVPLQQDQSQ